MRTIIATVCLIGLIGCGSSNGFTTSNVDGIAKDNIPASMEESDSGAVPIGTGGVANLPSTNVANETGGMPSAPMATGGVPSNPSGNGGSPVLGTGGMVAEGTGGIPSTNGGGSANGGTQSTSPHCPVETDPDLHCAAGTYTVDCVASLATFRVDRFWAPYLDKITSDASSGFTLTSTDAVTGFHFTAFCQGPVTFTLPVI